MGESEEKKTSVASREEEILQFWRDKKIFEQTENRGNSEFVFYDGPPFATGLPHVGHMVPGTIKDIIPRYQVMNGRKLRRRWGWDCHGLPMENEIEKELEISGKKAIEEYGIEKFNAEASKRVLRYAEDWKKIIPRVGRFVDMKDDYRTMDSSYTESVWWAFKTLDDKGLIYKGFKSMHMCPRCGTTLSNFEVNQGYKDITDISVVVKFKLAPGQKIGNIAIGDNTHLLAWTTTPWTLPGNVALAVNPNVDYLFCRSLNKNEFYILGDDRSANIISGKGEFAYTFFPGGGGRISVKGNELFGLTYEPPFPYYFGTNIENKQNAWRVYEAPFVGTGDGTEIVHIAPAFGEDDLKLAQEKKLPLIFHVDPAGKFVDAVKDFSGKLVKPKENPQETDIEIIKYLTKKNLLFAKEKITHSYPHCWRCDTPLLNYASSSWFVAVSKFKDRLVEENEKIRWVPESVGKYRFGNWLKDARDWSISRSRFWGAPIPVWESADQKKRLVIGSLETLRKYVKKSGNKYIVVRHGQGENNATGIIHGKSNSASPLTELGKKQVDEAGENLKKENIDLIVSSPFERAKQTAEILAQKIGIPKEAIFYDERIEEIHSGEFDGKTNDEYHAFFSPYLELLTKRPEGGENLLDVRRRAMEFLYELEGKYQNKTILISSHEYVAWMLWAGTFGWDKKQIFENKKDDFLTNAEYRLLPFVPLPHNRNFELDFHRPFIDEIELRDEEGNSLKRVPEVFDCWFESGSMPYGQWHFPFDTKNFNPDAEVGYPADFIAEGLDQTRGWFYSLLVLGVALFGRSPYKNVVVSGLVLAEDGQKMSKRLKNSPDLLLLAEKYGADAIRYFLMSSPAVRGEEIRFSERGIDEASKKIVTRLLNCLSFFEMYGERAPLSFHVLRGEALQSRNILDRWIVARLCEAIGEATTFLESYEIDRATRVLGEFIDDLSTWYVRRSRERLKSKVSEEREKAGHTLRFVLLEFSKVLAPFLPFTAEEVFRKVRTEESRESVHLELWPKISGIDLEVLAVMSRARHIVSLALEVRNHHGIRVRQPLAALRIRGDPFEGEEEALSVIADEVNVKSVVFLDGDGPQVELDLALTEALKEEGVIREIVRTIQELRKRGNFKQQDKILLGIENLPQETYERWKETIYIEVNASSVAPKALENPLESGEAFGIKVSLRKLEAES